MKQLSKRLTNLEDKMPVTVARDRKNTPEECAATYHRIMHQGCATSDELITINGRKMVTANDW